MTVNAKQIFVNLPIKNLQTSKAFFSKVGFTFNEQFEDETTTCMVISETIYVMLLEEERFVSFTKKEIPDNTNYSEAIVALSVGSRAEVDEIVNQAFAAGASKYNESQDHGFMYGWSFADLDGHLWEVFYMDESAAEEAAKG
ncbi:VOC family protein [Alkalicoccobacillus murimartini]|uniref:Lactoylglutathione lyase n=1 Tax=Alkalicoccobacillus murimartini TaxID=171685 RepID=A0ABT9YHX0_9BACI|nr:VOC family protein [Alkalicoccobacillus murimartini]MDQ0207455.1 putative lactoylglutathione lyase [Alkalicoccobacillus murimartini]